MPDTPRDRSPLMWLEAPPRSVPLSLRVRLIFGGFLPVFAWIWFGFGSSIAMVFLRHADLASWFQFRAELARASGVVERCEDTHASVGGSKTQRGTPVYANHYRFVADGRMHAGVSYATGTCMESGTAVLVEHVAGDPALSRVSGMRRATFGPEVLFVAIFPAVGVALVFFATRAGLRGVRLLAHGKFTLGRLIGQEATNVSINKRRVMKLRFEIEAGTDLRREVFVKTHVPEHLEDEPRERLLYDPARPGEALAWDLIPGAPRVDALGALQPAGLLGTILVLIPPTLAILGHVLVLS